MFAYGQQLHAHQLTKPPTQVRKDAKILNLAFVELLHHAAVNHHMEFIVSTQDEDNEVQFHAVKLPLQNKGNFIRYEQGLLTDSRPFSWSAICTRLSNLKELMVSYEVDISPYEEYSVEGHTYYVWIVISEWPRKATT